MVHVSGKNAGDVVLFALSTCPWCSKTKELLNKIGIDYGYVDVDLLEDKDRDEVKNALAKSDLDMVFPVIIVDGKKYILGYREKQIMALAGLK
jgi:glutaredoxin